MMSFPPSLIGEQKRFATGFVNLVPGEDEAVHSDCLTWSFLVLVDDLLTPFGYLDCFFWGYMSLEW